MKMKKKKKKRKTMRNNRKGLLVIQELCIVDWWEERVLDHGKDFCGSLSLTAPVKDGDILFDSLLGRCCLLYWQQPS
jgi:hypothetical protein